MNSNANTETQPLSQDYWWRGGVSFWLVAGLIWIRQSVYSCIKLQLYASKNLKAFKLLKWLYYTTIKNDITLQHIVIMSISHVVEKILSSFAFYVCCFIVVNNACDLCLLFCKCYAKTSRLPSTQLNLWSVRRKGPFSICTPNLKRIALFFLKNVTGPEILKKLGPRPRPFSFTVHT